MALIFADGFDSYAADADLTSKWDGVTAAQVAYGSAIGRTGGGGLRVHNIVTSTDTDTVFKNFAVTGDSLTNELIMSFAFKMEVNTDSTIEALVNFNTRFSTTNCSLCITPSTGTLHAFTQSSGGTNRGSSSAGAIVLDQWHWIEVKLAALNSGQMEVRVDEVSEINVTSTDFQGQAEAGVEQIVLGACNNSNATNGMVFDDVILMDESGSEFNSYLGDLEIQTLRPNAAGDLSDGTPTSGANYTNVDETGFHDGDTTVVDMSTAADTDLYNIEALTGTINSVKGVVVNNVAKNNGATVRTMRPKIKTNTVEYDGATLNVHGGVYRNLQHGWEINPNDSLAWEEADITALQIGQEVVA